MTKLCKKCNKEFTPTKGYVNYCGPICRSGREQTPEMLKKKSISNKKHWKDGGVFRNMDWDMLNNRPEKIKVTLEVWFLKAEQRILNGEQLNNETTKKYLIEKHGHKCWGCEATEWQGEKLHLEMDHIDGNNKNNDINNIRILCPNCHSITPTWRYKNIKNKKDNPKAKGLRSGYIL
jgi:5-methylcytosine-specific restriction endonuclease McrA